MNIPDHIVRREVFAWLDNARIVNGLGLDEALVLTRDELAHGFQLGGRRIPLVGPQGIFIPAVTDQALPLTITTATGEKFGYNDGFIDSSTLSYHYRGNDPNHRENRGLRELMHQRIPLVYLHRVVPGQYVVSWPVFIVGDNPQSHRFLVRVDDRGTADYWAGHQEVPDDFDTDYGRIRREYRTAQTRVRIHQQAFRQQVLSAYRDRCALCRLGHRPLLDAAHITADRDPLGAPEVTNGLSLCKIHHAAFDKLFLGIRPDYTVHIRQDLLDEIDGPMLQHGLKALHNAPIHVPRSDSSKPSKDRLEERYSKFLAL